MKRNVRKVDKDELTFRADIECRLVSKWNGEMCYAAMEKELPEVLVLHRKPCICDNC